ncbi:uncharacterized protein MONBRDRAFT_27417 [Monosiga brevicollis MX1]|uniref:rRNA-processing protein EFG1 n=1 Tax=Monosiga brevicollis TaxID=81824 RepID=A9V580_MONBE|nr:uncharacterized protein MONBRDRAFT_27417 [Monosiga brevicollis MX1]EDQ87229.1 predicted protein [Monosiga brevicollis MX1]|eukprot:XP_001747842.1 hypothetical protein [Monosiga brevicollis MX1]
MVPPPTGPAGQGRRPKPKNKSVRSQIRDVQRFLAKPDLPETVRVSQERKLAALKEELGDQQHSNRERAMQKKYRMVKFFERRKLMRRRGQLQAAIAKSDEERAATLQQELQKVESKMLYVRRFPKTQKYISILKPDTELTKGACQQRDNFFNKILASVEAGELVYESQDEDDEFNQGNSGRSSAPARGKRSARESQHILGAASDDDSDAEADNAFADSFFSAGTGPALDSVAHSDPESAPEAEAGPSVADDGPPPSKALKTGAPGEKKRRRKRSRKTASTTQATD